MNAPMNNWLVLGLTFAGVPAMALGRWWEEDAASEPEAASSARAPEAVRIAGERSPEAGYAFLRLYRVSDEMMDADRRGRRVEGMVRAPC